MYFVCFLSKTMVFKNHKITKKKNHLDIYENLKVMQILNNKEKNN